jgi:NAD(P)-dependent dehydrogenase (short-subunit alcohol dehydrogenase family)
MNPKNRVVILTGATKGIGRATADLLAGAGCRLALAARSAEPLQALAEGLPHAAAIPTDMGDTTQAAALAHKAVEIFGRLDVVINNAGLGVRDNLINLREEEARRVMDVNYFGPVALIQAAIPHLKANPNGGLIINISSIVGRRAMPGLAGYCASKGALEKMGESLRLELKPDNIRVSTIYPGVTFTQFNHNSLGSNRADGRGLTGVPPERVARAILSAIRHEGRDVFVTPFDWTFVTVSMAWPWLMDQLLYWHMRR